MLSAVSTPFSRAQPGASQGGTSSGSIPSSSDTADHGTDGGEQGREVVGAERPVPASDLSSSSTPERQHLHADGQSKRLWPTNGEVATELRRLIPSGSTHALLLATLQLGVPKTSQAGQRAPSMPGSPATRTERLCCKATHSAGQHGQAAWTGAAALCHTEQGKQQGGKRKVSTVPGGANTCCQRADPAAHR